MVVNITTLHEERVQSLGGFPFFFFDFGSPFDFFGRRRPNNNKEGDQVIRRKALGSGFIIHSAGYVVTNEHVVEKANEVRVKVADGREFLAVVKGKDRLLDLAILELKDARDLRVASLGSSELVQDGEFVIAIGNPFGLEFTVTTGVVSARGRIIGAGPYDDFIQTNALINPGNSGGPLFNLKGQVVGINTAIQRDGQGIGFAIPVNALKEVVSDLLTIGHVERGKLGVVIQGDEISGALAEALGLPGKQGVIIAEVEPNSTAERAGLQSGDVILAVEGIKVTRPSDFPRLIARHKPKTKVKIDIWSREKKQKTVTVILGALEVKEEESEDGSGEAEEGASLLLSRSEWGVTLVEQPAGSKEEVRVVVAWVARGSIMEGILERGDILLEVNWVAIKRRADVEAAIQRVPPGASIAFKIQRQNRIHYVAAKRSPKHS
ncbi:hypothetical protein BCY86_00805 [Pajaroellobacter abortibovis]|uniref:PDZ domain-containing protein n=1 Tax=Pajaroellobacter abortibovis TaxID=1882918 RepID=A0A1L6MZ80_9BACT|nr:hypothetical protein BCY86_00805 [Pajaroellobacter abortibovis]